MIAADGGLPIVVDGKIIGGDRRFWCHAARTMHASLRRRIKTP